MTERPLRIRWAGGDKTFPPGRAVSIGRDPGADVVLTPAGVSRRHAEVRWNGDRWVYQDLTSSQGSFRDGVGASAVPVDDTVEIVLGQGRDAPRLTLSSLHATVPEATELPAAAAATALPTGATGGGTGAGTGGWAPTSVGPMPGDAGPARPGGALRPGAAGATVVSGDVLRLECGGRSYEFRPGQDVTVGRDDTCDVLTTNPTVSRQHARLSHTGGAWVLSDLGSSAGTYLDGKRVDRQPIHGSMAFWLGDPDVGERVVVVAGGERKLGPMARLDRAGRRGRAPLLLALAGILVVALVAGLITYVATRSSGPDQGVLARGSVKLVADNYTGSGTIIDAARGLILTNAHVAAPDAPGSGVREATPGSELLATPRQLTVLVAPASGKAAEPRFFAVPVAVDAYLDLAVMKTTKTAAGALVEPGDLDGLRQVPLGNSADVKAGQNITVVGYPGIAASRAATVTKGVVSGFEQDDRLRTNRAQINTDAEINPGNSGGLVANDDGRIIGVASALRPNRANAATGKALPGKIGIIRPLALAMPLIDAARRGKTYSSPYITPLTGSEALSNFRAAEAVDGIALGCRPVDQMPTGTISVAFDYSGFPAGQHQDLLAYLLRETDLIGSQGVRDQWPFRWEGSGCATVTFNFGEPVPDGKYTLLLYAGPNYKKLASLTYRVGTAGTPGASPPPPSG